MILAVLINQAARTDMGPVYGVGFAIVFLVLAVFAAAWRLATYLASFKKECQDKLDNWRKEAHQEIELVKKEGTEGRKDLYEKIEKIRVEFVSETICRERRDNCSNKGKSK